MTPEEQDPDASVDAAVASLFSELPRPVQEFIVSPARAQIATELSQKYALHVDQAGVFERSYILMLLGALSPQDFARDLTQSGISDAVAQKLLVEVNERVFVPIQQAERAQSSTPVVSPGTKPITERPAPVPAEAPQAATPPQPEPEPLAPPIPVPEPVPAAPLPTPPPPQQWDPQPLQQPWQPTATVHVYLPPQPPVVVPPVPVASMPVSSAVPTPPQQASYPESTYQVREPSIPSTTLPTPEPPVRSAPPPPNLPGVPVVTPPHHTNDPYREPL